MIRNMSSGDVWIKKHGNILYLINSSSLEIERKLQEYFTSGYPVVLSSGRSAISMALRYFYKSDVVRIFPFASQCVVNSILQAGLTPITPLDYSSLDVSYNQWGRLNSNLENLPFIEDSVDSFYPAHSEILRSGAEFEVWSLQKIFGLNFGAVLWCKNESDAKKIRELRDRGTHYLKMLKRVFFRLFKSVHGSIYDNWEKLEHQHLPLFGLEYGQILERVARWDDLYNERKKSYYNALSHLGLADSVDFEDFREVIPVVIEIPNHISITSYEDILTLHCIVNVKKVSSVSVFPYQLKL